MPFVSTVMPLELIEAVIPQDFDDIYATAWEAWTHPRNVMWDLLNPVPESDPDAQARAIAAAAARQFEATRDDPDDQWLKVVDTETGEIAGGALWKVHRTNPYRAPVPPTDAFWWPEGSEMRSLTNALFEQFRLPRTRKMQVAHMC